MKVTTSIQAGKAYTINPGDTLASIAEQTYGDPDLWVVIYEYQNNRVIIGPDPNRLPVGAQIELWE